MVKVFTRAPGMKAVPGSSVGTQPSTQSAHRRTSCGSWHAPVTRDNASAVHQAQHTAAAAAAGPTARVCAAAAATAQPAAERDNVDERGHSVGTGSERTGLAAAATAAEAAAAATEAAAAAGAVAAPAAAIVACTSGRAAAS